MLRTAGIGRDERQIDFGLHGGRELDLCSFRRIAQTLQGHLVALAAQVETFVFLEFVDKPIHQPLVKVVSAQVRVTVGGLHLDHAFADFEDRNVERSAAEVVHGDRLVLAFIETIGESSRCGLVNDALHFQAGNLSSIFRSLPLRIIEICRNCNDRFRDFLAQIVFRRLLQLLQNQCGDLGRGMFLPLGQHGYVVARLDDLIRDHLDLFLDFVVAASHEPLDRIDGILRVGNGLPLCDLAY